MTCSINEALLQIGRGLGDGKDAQLLGFLYLLLSIVISIVIVFS